MSSPHSDFYVTGGTLRRDAPSYVPRQADRDLHDALAQGRFCYVLTSRQVGKSSLMVRTATRLREEGAAVAVLDLTEIGQNLTAEQWYNGLLNVIGEELGLEDELEEFWLAESRLGPLQRWLRAIREVVLVERTGRVVIFIDEIDATRSLPFQADEFFAGIRELYNRRTRDRELERLAFCLVGVATPSDLIQDPMMTPFNVGHRVELTDFTEDEAEPLAKGLGRDERLGRALLGRVLYWTGGHPYLTQRLCLAVSEDGKVRGPGGVDRVCERLFLSAEARDRDDNLLSVRDRLLRSGVDLAGLLDLYTRVRAHERIRHDETSPLVSVLQLSGITRVAEGYLYVRNRIYYRVFDRKWVRAHMPDAELRRQRAAYRRGLMRATAVAAVVLAVMAGLAFEAVTQRNAATISAQAAERARDEAERAGARAVEEQANAEQRRAEAERERLEADRQRAKAEEESRRAVEARANAERRRVETEQQRRIAEVERRRAEDRELKNRQFLYVADINRAQRAWETPDVERVRELLGAQQGGPAGDLRGFEWYYLRRLAEGGSAFRLSGQATSLAFAPDGGPLAVGSRDGSVRLWDRAAGWREPFDAHENQVTAVAFSPDGKTLATASWDRTVKLWDAATPGEPRELRGHAGPVTSVAFSPEGDRLVSGSTDNTAIVWDLKSGRPVASPEFAGQVNSVAFSPDGRLLASGDDDGLVSVWDAAADEPRPLGRDSSPVTAVAFSPDGSRVASGSLDGAVTVWDVATKRSVALGAGHAAQVSAVAFSPDGKSLATASWDRTVKVWDLATGQARTFKGHTDSVTAVAFAPGGGMVASAGDDGSVRFWEAGGEQDWIRAAGHKGAVESLAFSPDGARVATAGEDGTVRLWDAATGDALGALEGHAGRATAVAFLPDGRRFVSASVDGTVKLWEAGAAEPRVLPYTSEVSAMALSPGGRLLALGGLDGSVALRDLESRQEDRYFGEGHAGQVNAVAFSPDGRTLATASRDRTVKLWDVASRGLLYTIPGEVDARTVEVLSVAFSPDGSVLAMASRDRTVVMWDVGANERRAELAGHTKAVTSVAFSPDGRRLATAGRDGTVKLWDVETRLELYSFGGHAGGVTAVAFSPDGRALASADRQGAVVIYSAAEGGAAQHAGARGAGRRGRSLYALARLERVLRVWTPGRAPAVRRDSARTSASAQTTARSSSRTPKPSSARPSTASTSSRGSSGVGAWARSTSRATSCCATASPSRSSRRR
jgi:WD40 repeat protein